ncbi:MAG: hypothetical protein ACP5GJ_02560 [Nanopusillaceae archaeon]
MSPIPISFNVTDIQNITSSVAHITSNISLGFIVAIMLIFTAIILLTLVIKNILSSIIPKLSLLVFILASSYLLAFAYYVPKYIPNTFTVVSNNTVIVNTNVTSDLLSPYNFILITKFYDNLLYYMAQYNVSISDLLVPYVILILFYIYFAYSLYDKTKKWAILIAALLLFVTTVGLKGLIYASMTYTTLLFLDIIVALLSMIILVLI